MRRSARDVLLILVAAVGLSVFGGVSLFRRTEELQRANPVLQRQDDPASAGAAAPGNTAEVDVIAFRKEEEESEGNNERGYRASEAEADPAIAPPQQQQQPAQQDGPGFSADVAAPGTAVEADAVASRQEQEERQEGGEGANPASGAKAGPSPVAVAQHTEQQGAAKRYVCLNNSRYPALARPADRRRSSVVYVSVACDVRC